MFGTSDAPEIHQNTIQKVFQGCDGASNISDDIIVHYKTKQERDKRLETVLKRLALTFNHDKYSVRMARLTFMGHTISHEKA